MNALLNNISFFILTFGAITAHAQLSSLELTCRAKAKEIATHTYSGCVTEARNTQVDQIRKDYQKQLTDLKAKYDRELKKVSGKGFTKATTIKQTHNITSASTGSTPRATKGIAKTLPTRREVKNTAPAAQSSTQSVQEDKIMISPDSSTPDVESEATQNKTTGELKIELVPVPGSSSSDKSAVTSDDQTY